MNTEPDLSINHYRCASQDELAKSIRLRRGDGIMPGTHVKPARPSLLVHEVLAKKVMLMIFRS